MKPIFALFLAASLTLPAFAQTQQLKPLTLMGAWAVDTSRLPMPPEARPKSVTITFSQPQAERVTARVEVVDAANGHLYALGTTSLDGKPAPVEGNLEASAAATLMPVPGVLVMQLARDGMPVSTRVYALSANGQTMVETVAYVGADGQPLVKTNHFSRLR